MDTATMVTEPLIALDSVKRAARIIAGITAESVAETDKAVTAPQYEGQRLSLQRKPNHDTEEHCHA
jgi:hypothetical protein